MAIRKRDSKKEKSGYTYQVYFPYKDIYGVTSVYRKGGFKTKKDAKEHEAKVMSEYMETGIMVGDKYKTLSEVYREYMNLQQNNYSQSTKQYYGYTYNRYIKDRIGFRLINELKYRDLQLYFNQLECGLPSAKNVKKVFNVTFKYARKCGYIKENPMKLVELDVKETNSKSSESLKVISEEDFKRICEEMLVIRKYDPHGDYALFNYLSYTVAMKIAWYTGMRVSEVLGLHKSDIDFEQRTINIQRRLEYHGLKSGNYKPVNKLKTNASKAIVPLAEPLKALLLEWFEKNPYEMVIATIEGNYVGQQAISSRISQACKKLNIEGFRFHSLRHTFTTNLAKNGISPNVAKDLARHSDITTTLNVYTHMNQSDQRKAIDEVFKSTIEK